MFTDPTMADWETLRDYMCATMDRSRAAGLINTRESQPYYVLYVLLFIIVFIILKIIPRPTGITDVQYNCSTTYK